MPSPWRRSGRASRSSASRPTVWPRSARTWSCSGTWGGRPCSMSACCAAAAPLPASSAGRRPTCQHTPSGPRSSSWASPWYSGSVEERRILSSAEPRGSPDGSDEDEATSLQGGHPLHRQNDSELCLATQHAPEDATRYLRSRSRPRPQLRPGPLCSGSFPAHDDRSRAQNFVCICFEHSPSRGPGGATRWPGAATRRDYNFAPQRRQYTASKSCAEATILCCCWTTRHSPPGSTSGPGEPSHPLGSSPRCLRSTLASE